MQVSLEPDDSLITLDEVLRAGLFVDTDGELNFVTPYGDHFYISNSDGRVYKTSQFEEDDLASVTRLLPAGSKITITV